MKKLVVFVVALMFTGCAKIESRIEVDCNEGILYYTYTQEDVERNRIVVKESGVLTYKDKKVARCVEQSPITLESTQ